MILVAITNRGLAAALTLDEPRKKSRSEVSSERGSAG